MAGPGIPMIRDKFCEIDIQRFHAAGASPHSHLHSRRERAAHGQTEGSGRSTGTANLLRYARRFSSVAGMMT